MRERESLAAATSFARCGVWDCGCYEGYWSEKLNSELF